MQQRETDQEETKTTQAPAGPTSQPLQPVIPQGVDAKDDDPEEIFLNAVAEIDTQPLVQVKRRRAGTVTIADVLEGVFLVSVLLVGFLGILWQCITFPHTLVILYAVERPASLTTTLDIPTRTLAPVTLTRVSTSPTTGHGHQDAQAATGTLTFYNGQLQSVNVPSGSLFTGRDGTQIRTTQSAVVPALDSTTTPPTLGQVSVSAQAVHPGANGNIPAYDISGSCCSASVIVKNLSAFTGGRDARAYQAVGQSDIDRLTLTVQKTLETAFTTAFPLRPGETLHTTTCSAQTAADHTLGQEAQTVTVTIIKTCSAVAYSQDELTREATAALTQTKPGAQYHLVGSVQTTVQSITPVSMTISGKWAYTFSPDYQQFLAEKIQGETPQKAKAYLLKTGVISYASIPGTLPPAMYINFLVLVG